MPDINLNLGITNPIPLSINLSPVETNFSLSPINVNLSIGGGGGSGSGTVTTVSVASPLSNALTFSNPTTIPSLSIVSTANPTTKFLRADGFWVAPSSGSGTVTSISVSVPAGFNVSPSSITTSGTFAITYDPAVKIPPLQLGGAGGTATTFLNGLGNWVTPAGAGTVTSVDLTMPAAFRVSGNPVTGAGTLAVAYGTGTIPPANLGFNAPTAGTYLQGNGSWTALTIPTSWSGTGSATAKLAYALPAVSGTQTGSFQQLSFADLSGAPFTLTTSGSSGAATFTGGTLNIPQYSGGGGGGGGTGWTSAANIGVGDIVYAIDLTGENVIPGATGIYSGNNVYLKEWLGLTSSLLTSTPWIVLNNLYFSASIYTNNGFNLNQASLAPTNFSNATYYQSGTVGTMVSSTDLRSTQTTSVFTPPANVVSSSVFYFGNTMYQSMVTWTNGSLQPTMYVYSSSATDLTTGWSLKFTQSYNQSFSGSNTLFAVGKAIANGAVVVLSGGRVINGTTFYIVLVSTNNGASFISSTYNFNHNINVLFSGNIYLFDDIASTSYLRIDSSGAISVLTRPRVLAMAIQGGGYLVTYSVGTNNVDYTQNGTTWTTATIPAGVGFVQLVRYQNAQFELFCTGSALDLPLRIFTTTDFVTFSEISFLGTTPSYSFFTSNIVTIGQLTRVSSGTNYFISYDQDNLVVFDSERIGFYTCPAGSYRYLGGNPSSPEDGLWVRTA